MRKTSIKKTEREEQSRSSKTKKIRTTLLNCINLLKVGQCYNKNSKHLH